MNKSAAAIKNYVIQAFLTVGTIFSTLLLVSCTNTDTDSENIEAYSATGSYSCSIEWSDNISSTGDELFHISAVDCASIGVVTVTFTFYDGNNVRLVEEQFACDLHSGTVENIPAGSNRQLVVTGSDLNGTVLYRGEQTGISINENQTTHGGEITMVPVEDDPDDPVEDDPDHPIDGLVAHYPFNGNANDEINNNNGVVYGPRLVTDRLGNSNGAYSFDGIDDDIKVAHSDLIEFGMNSFSISLWLKAPVEQVFSLSSLVEKDYSWERSGLYRVRLYNGYPQFQIHGFAFDGIETSYYLIGNTEVADDSWHHIVCVRDAGERKIRIYVDGIEDAIPLSEETLHDTSSRQALSLGGPTLPSLSQEDVNMYKGLLDDVRLYDRALSREEIQGLAGI